jgi:sugar phosphate isomerase/epimerase
VNTEKDGKFKMNIRNMKNNKNKLSRRRFLGKSALLGTAGFLGPVFDKSFRIPATPRMTYDDISLAQWALVQEIRDGKWKTLDFARIAREDFDLNGIEFVNTLFEVPTVNYLNQLKKNADEHGVKMVLIMVDAEGDGCESTKELRKQFVVNHKKWIDIAHYLGCHAIRTNCRGPANVDPEEALKWAAESYDMLLEYAVQANISVVIENHGGVSNDADWMVRLFETVDHLYFGSYPDWRRPSDTFDNFDYLEKMLPWAGGMSYRNQPSEELTAKMIKLCRDSGYKGWYGIESGGREEIIKGRDLLKKYLF